MEENIDLPFEVNLSISEKNGKPYLEVRRGTDNPEIIKKIINSALKREPIILYPKFTYPMKSIATLIEKGVLWKNPETQQLEFNI